MILLNQIQKSVENVTSYESIREMEDLVIDLTKESYIMEHMLRHESVPNLLWS